MLISVHCVLEIHTFFYVHLRLWTIGMLLRTGDAFQKQQYR